MVITKVISPFYDERKWKVFFFLSLVKFCSIALNADVETWWFGSHKFHELPVSVTKC